MATRPSRLLPRHPLTLPAAAVLALAGAARAQDAPAVQSVEVTAHAPESSDVAGFGQPLARTPIQVDVIGAKLLADLGATSLSDITRIDASLTDSYNAVGYWSTFAVRGFQVDNRTNFRRDGLPINAETVLSLDNKSDVEVLKGLSGIQAGTSAPGGLVDLVVKRPDQDLRDVLLRWSQTGSVGVAADISQRFGERRQFGARVNLSTDRLDPNFRDARGHAHAASIATDWRPDDAHRLEFEFEHSLQSQPSVPAFSMLGPVVPDPHAIDPHVNLNDQPWSQPVVTQGNTLSLRYTQALGAQWRLKVQALQQKLVSNDHLAFAFGANEACDPCDRFAADGTYAIYDFRSDDERRTTRDLDVSLSGAFDTGPLRHALTAGALATRFTARFGDEAYNFAGISNIAGTAIVPASPATLSPNTNRTEASDELYLRDAVAIGDWTAWLGLRHTRLRRQSAETAAGSAAFDTDYRQAFTTPWLSLSRQLTGNDMVYLSWGQGVESTIAPAHGDAINNGQPLSATLSRQWEIGWKHASGVDTWGLTAYDVKQAYSGDVQVGANAEGPVYTFEHDGITHSRGIEAAAQTRLDALTLRASATLQRVTRARSLVASNDGLRPTNIPASALKLLASYAVAQLPGLSVTGNVAFEGGREVLPDNSAKIPGWLRVDLGARYTQTLARTTLVWRAGVDNLFDRRAWREAPYQYDHAYLFPLAPRTFNVSVEAKF